MAVELQPDVTTPGVDRQVLSNGHVRLRSRREPEVSSYLQYLPAPYQLQPPGGDADDPDAQYIDLGRFLLIFESILGPIERTVDNLASYFDPRMAPEHLLPWLANWVGLELDENWPLAQRRMLIVWAARLYRWRGTRRGLRDHLRLYTGQPPLIVENFDGARLGQDACLGLNTRIGSAAARPHTLKVTVLADQPSQIDERIVRQIIEFQKPAHVDYSFEIRAAGARS